MFTLIETTPLEIYLDPVSTQERLPSVAFDITINWVMPYQNAQINIKECWLEYSELKRFENELKQFINLQTNSVNLNNMSSVPIIMLKKDSEKIIFEIMVTDSASMGVISIKIYLYEQELVEMAQNIKNWAKWW